MRFCHPKQTARAWYSKRCEILEVTIMYFQVWKGIWLHKNKCNSHYIWLQIKELKH